MFTPIKDIIGHRSSFSRFKKDINAATIVLSAKKACVRIWGEGILDHMHPISFSEGILKIAVVAGPASAELSKKSEDLISDINSQCGGSPVQKIVIEY